MLRADIRIGSSGAARAHIMQLRVARLCLDCEELHVDSSCPVCASERYAFLSTWLPSEERRRWRRPAPQAIQRTPRSIQALRGLLARWFGDGELDEPTRALRTRASDHVPSLHIDEPAEQPPKPGAHVSRPVKGDLR